MMMLQSVWNFIESQLLKMEWLSDIVFFIVNPVAKWLNISPSSHIFESLHYFVYDVFKIFILLSTLIFAISYVQSYFPPERTRKILSHFSGISANIVSALMGTITPFCSCSSIPLFIGFTQAGIKNGITFSFLISSPLVDLGALVILISTFGVKIALVYVIMGLVLAVIGGIIIDKANLQDQIKINIPKKNISKTNQDSEFDFSMTVRERIEFSKGQVAFTFKKVYLYVILGVGIGAFIHDVIPKETVMMVLGNGFFAPLIATALGIPLYADLFGVIPIAQALFEKGVGIGTILSFMMSVTALSLPSIIMISKVIKPKLLFMFVSIVAFGIVMIGYVFNFVFRFI